jgi:hypothetical protein
MTIDDLGNGESPQIVLRQVSLASGESQNLWRIGWRVENCARHSLRIEAVRFPHSQFRAAEQRFDPAISLGHEECAEFETSVACDAEPGAIVENAFNIFSAVWRDQPWRIFVRLRVSVNSEGEPEALTELITTQQVGFSAELGPDR